jgi:hypothetical protein
LSAPYDAFGDTGTTVEELEWKTPIFCVRVVPKPTSTSCAWGRVGAGAHRGLEVEVVVVALDLELGRRAVQADLKYLK